MKSRRNFLRILTGAIAMIAVKPLNIVKAVVKKLAIPLEKTPKLKKIGGSLILKLKGEKVLFVRTGEEEVKAFCANCSHQRVLLTYDGKKDHLVCPEHGSTFDMAGNVLKGPADKPLCTYETTLKEDKIVIAMETEE